MYKVTTSAKMPPSSGWELDNGGSLPIPSVIAKAMSPWYLGEDNQKCTKVCSDQGRICDQTALESVMSDTDATHAAYLDAFSKAWDSMEAQMGAKFPGRADHCKMGNDLPSRDWSPRIILGHTSETWPYYDCLVGTSTAPRCDAGTPGGHRRLCPCAPPAEACTASSTVTINPPETQRTYDTNHPGHTHSMLDDSGPAWIAKLDGAKTHWMKIDLGGVTCINGLITQGRASSTQWVTKYRVETSADGAVWHATDPQEFNANINTNGKVTNTFPGVKARYVKISPQNWYSLPAMRAAVIGEEV